MGVDISRTLICLKTWKPVDLLIGCLAQNGISLLRMIDGLL